jgi:hypothetical protein
MPESTRATMAPSPVVEGVPHQSSGAPASGTDTSRAGKRGRDASTKTTCG